MNKAKSSSKQFESILRRSKPRKSSGENNKIELIGNVEIDDRTVEIEYIVEDGSYNILLAL